MSDDHTRRSERADSESTRCDDETHSLARTEKAEIKLKELKRNFYGGTVFGLLSTVLSVMGMVEHRDMWIIVGLLGLGVAIKLIPFSEVRKLVRRGD